MKDKKLSRDDVRIAIDVATDPRYQGATVEQLAKIAYYRKMQRKTVKP